MERYDTFSQTAGSQPPETPLPIQANTCVRRSGSALNTWYRPGCTFVTRRPAHLVSSLVTLADPSVVVSP